MARSFKGGIVLGGNKSARYIKTEYYFPKEVVLYAPEDRRAKYKIGDAVKRGDTVLKSSESSNRPAVLCSISGSVSKVTPESITVMSDGKNKLSEKCLPLEESILDYTSSHLRSELLDRGISLPHQPEKPVKYLIINCVENDSYISSGTRIIMEQADKIIGGAKIIMRMFSVRRAVCAVSSNMLRCADQLESYADRSMIKVKMVSRKFPQQEPLMLISALFNLEINPTIDPLNVGYLTVSPETCAAVYSALAEGIPYTSRIITVSGDCTGKVCNKDVPFGTRVGELLESCGGITREPQVILCGGEMSGKVLEKTDLTDINTCAVTAMSKSQLPQDYDPLPCISCGRCAAACPVRIMPAFINREAVKGKIENCLKLDIECCIGCGCCTAVCPSGIDLAESICRAKEVINGIAEPEPSDVSSEPVDGDIAPEGVEFMDSYGKEPDKKLYDNTASPVTVQDAIDSINNSQKNVNDTVVTQPKPVGNLSDYIPKPCSNNSDIFAMPSVVSEEELSRPVTEPMPYYDEESDEEDDDEDAPLNEYEMDMRINVNYKRPPSRRMNAALRSMETVTTFCIDFLIAMLPLLAWSVYLFGARPLVITAVSVATCWVIDIAVQFGIYRSVSLRDLTPAVIGVMIALGLPPTAQLWLPALGAIVAMMVRWLARYTNIVTLDPAVSALTSLWVVFPLKMSAFCATGVKLPAFAMSVFGYTTAGTSAVESLAQNKLPQFTLGSMVVGMRPGLIGEMSALLLIAGGIYLICRKIIRPGLPIAFIATVFIISYFAPQVPIVSDLIAIQFASYEVLAGDVLLGAVILAASPSVAPISSRAGVICGVLGGGITVLLRFFAGSNAAVVCALLVMSVLARPLDRLLLHSVFGGRSKKK